MEEEKDIFEKMKFKPNFLCDADWNRMQGDERSRHCKECNKNVYNLLETPLPEILDLVQKKEGRFCGRFYLRNDGTVTLQECAGNTAMTGDISIVPQDPDSF